MNMTSILFAFRDITKVKLIDQSLQKSEARYRGLDNLDAGVVVHAADTVIMSNIIGIIGFKYRTNIR
jgi:uncharacterized protein YciW